MLALGAAMVATSIAAFARTAHADPSGSVDWMRVLTDMDVVARKGMGAFDTPRCVPAACFSPVVTSSPAAERVTEPNVQNAGNAWFGVAPRVSLVARDWGSSFKVAGDRLALVDAMRLTSSTRMVLSRVRLSDRRFTPFAQLGLGQWRIDPYLMPLTPRQTEIAAQIGGGFEVRVLRTWQVAVETSATIIYRDDVQPGDAPLPRMWSTIVASRLEF